MADLEPSAGERLGRVLLRLPSPPFPVTAPKLYNRELIPPGPLRAMEHSWCRGEFPGCDVVFSMVENAIVAGDGLVFTDALKLVPASFTGHSPDEVERARKAVEEELANGGPPERSGSYVLCKKNGARNYGHWLMEMFPKAALALRELADTGLWFVVPAPGGRLDAVITDSMQALGVDRERLWRADETPVRVERLVLVEGLSQHGGYMSPLVIEAVRRLAQDIPPGPHRRLYIPRETAARRTFLDAAGVAARAAASGHVAFTPGTADLRTQIGTCAGAERIVGVMGAAMTNIVFAPADAEIVLLAPAGMPDTFFWFIAALRGLRYIEVRCPVSEPSDDPKAWMHQMLLFPEPLAATIFPPVPPDQIAPPTPDPPRAAPTAPAGRVYRCVELPHLLRTGAAQATAFLPESVVEVPPPAFGETDPARLGGTDSVPPGARGETLRHGPVDAWVLRDALVHSHYGVVTCGDAVLGESTGHLPLHIIPGAEWLDDGTRLRLPDWPVAAELPNAYYLLNGNQDNYFHWMLETIARFNAADFRGLGVLGEVGPDLRLLAPPLDAPWKRQSFELLVPPGLPTHVMAEATSVRVERLIYFQRLSGNGLLPHRGLLPVFERMRASAYAALQAAPAAPWRKLFVSRADSRNRVLVNEAELSDLAAAAGFERVVLGTISVAEQVRLFAEATHVIAAHGAGLTNLLLCRPGAAVCELQMDCYLHWAFRRLAALRGLRYGCLVGNHIPPSQRSDDRNTWRIDPAQVDAVLADPRFVGV
jgi:capsular polysaccharide biosynthesis protein